MNATFEGCREVFAQRCLARARFWRAKALDLRAHPDSCILRAQECEEMAQIALTLRESYEPPERKAR